MLTSGNLFEASAVGVGGEIFQTLLTGSAFRLERIVSYGHATPVGQWFDQEQAEWVVLLSGGAGLRIEGESAVRSLKPGDYVYLPAHLRHRVEWTARDVETVWVALHHDPAV